MTFPNKEECWRCGTEVDRKDGAFIKMMDVDQPENNSGLQIQFARWFCNGCIDRYKEFMENES